MSITSNTTPELFSAHAKATMERLRTALAKAHGQGEEA